MMIWVILYLLLSIIFPVVIRKLVGPLPIGVLLFIGIMGPFSVPIITLSYLLQKLSELLMKEI